MTSRLGMGKWLTFSYSVGVVHGIRIVQTNCIKVVLKNLRFIYSHVVQQALYDDILEKKKKDIWFDLIKEQGFLLSLGFLQPLPSRPAIPPVS